MLKAEIKPGTEYALRENRVPGVPLQRVRVLEHVRGNKWKAEWIDPNPGLTDYVESGQLLVPWKEHKRFLKDEAAEAAIRDHNRRQGYKKNSPIDVALIEIFESVGEDVHYERGTLTGSPECLERIQTRAQMDPAKPSIGGYQDRHGVGHLPFDEALELARTFCAAEPATVLIKIESTERQWSQGADRPGEEYLADLLNDNRPAWALIRQWAGLDAAVAEREKRIQRLERLVMDAIYALQKAGLDAEAARIRRAIEGR